MYSSVPTSGTGSPNTACAWRCAVAAGCAWPGSGRGAWAASGRRRISTCRPAPGGGLTGRYLNNKKQASTPVLTRVQAIGTDWGTGAPGSGMPADRLYAA